MPLVEGKHLPLLAALIALSVSVILYWDAAANVAQTHILTLVLMLLVPFVFVATLYFRRSVLAACLSLRDVDTIDAIVGSVGLFAAVLLYLFGLYATYRCFLHLFSLTLLSISALTLLLGRRTHTALYPALLALGTLPFTDPWLAASFAQSITQTPSIANPFWIPSAALLIVPLAASTLLSDNVGKPVAGAVFSAYLPVAVITALWWLMGLALAIAVTLFSVAVFLKRHPREQETCIHPFLVLGTCTHCGYWAGGPEWRWPSKRYFLGALLFLAVVMGSIALVYLPLLTTEQQAVLIVDPATGQARGVFDNLTGARWVWSVVEVYNPEVLWSKDIEQCTVYELRPVGVDLPENYTLIRIAFEVAPARISPTALTVPTPPPLVLETGVVVLANKLPRPEIATYIVYRTREVLLYWATRLYLKLEDGILQKTVRISIRAKSGRFYDAGLTADRWSGYKEVKEEVVNIGLLIAHRILGAQPATKFADSLMWLFYERWDFLAAAFFVLLGVGVGLIQAKQSRTQERVSRVVGYLEEVRGDLSRAYLSACYLYFIEERKQFTLKELAEDARLDEQAVGIAVRVLHRIGLLSAQPEARGTSCFVYWKPVQVPGFE